MINTKKTVIATISFFVLINELIAQQWVWDEIEMERQDTPSEGFSFGGLILLCVLVAIIWLIGKGVKAGKEEHAKKIERRKQNEKKTNDILSNMDSIINSINTKNE